MNWTDRSRDRKLALRLASPDAADANMAGRHPRAKVGIWDGGPIYQLPVIDEKGLRFDVIPGKGIPDWYADLNHRYGANSVMHVQWQQWFSPEFMGTLFRTATGGYPGIKLAVISSFERTSSWGKLVVTAEQQRFLSAYQYDQNGNTFNFNAGLSPAVDFDMQPKAGVAPSCFYSKLRLTPQGTLPPGCIGIVGGEWITFDCIVETGDLIPGTKTWDCERKFYMTFGGQKQLVIHYGNGSRGYKGRNTDPFAAIWLAPYMTNRDPTQQHPVAPVWYRELIVDDKPIAEPSETSDTMTAHVRVTVAGKVFEGEVELNAGEVELKIKE